MAKTDIWMPLYIGEYLADTIGLSYAEHGAYLLSIMKYWRKGCALTPEEMKEACGEHIKRVSLFYTLENRLWHHKRIDLELNRAFERQQAAQEKAKKGVAARRASGSLPPKKQP